MRFAVCALEASLEVSYFDIVTLRTKEAQLCFSIHTINADTVRGFCLSGRRITIWHFGGAPRDEEARIHQMTRRAMQKCTAK
jgi:hypothetical protein